MEYPKNTKFGLSDGSTTTFYTGSKGPEDIVRVQLRKIMLEEYQLQPNEDGKVLHSKNFQAAYDDWADTAEENARNDGWEPGTYTESLDNMVDNWANRYWVVIFEEDKTPYSWNNTLHYEAMMAAFRKHNIKEHTFVIEAE